MNSPDPSHPDPLQDPQFASLVERLKAQEEPRPSVDFTVRTMAARYRPRSLRTWGLPAIAAGLALLLGAGRWIFHPGPLQLQAGASSPVAILMAAQGADGGWSADVRQSPSRYDVSLTALALLALMQQDAATDPGPEAAAIRAGLAHLLRQQRPDGRFGADFSGSAFTHYLATMCMISALDRVAADPDWAAAAARARPHLPPTSQMTRLNANLARPELFPERWADAGGPVAHAALAMLKR